MSRNHALLTNKWNFFFPESFVEELNTAYYKALKRNMNEILHLIRIASFSQSILSISLAWQ